MEGLQNLARIQIVLVEPQDGANVGAVCRAMKTMGMNRLAIVGDKDYDLERVRMMAIHAFDLYQNHQRWATLPEALQDSVLAVGTSRRRGKNRKYFAITPEQLAERIAATGPGTISIVYGREADGLTDAELAACHMSVRIPTSEAFPSLNLAQAVQIVAYVLFRANQPVAGWEPVAQDRIEELTHTIGDSFDRIGFYKQDERPEVERFFRDILARATLSEGEAARLQKMFIKMARLKVHKDS